MTNQIPVEKLQTWVLQIIKHLHTEKFYGKITFEFKNGMVCLVRKEETVKPPTNTT